MPQKGEMKQGHKYIKRTGSPGHYRYWYRDDKGRLYFGHNAPVGHEHHEGKKDHHDYISPYDKKKGETERAADGKINSFKESSSKRLKEHIENAKIINPNLEIDYYTHKLADLNSKGDNSIYSNASADALGIVAQHEIVQERFRSKYNINLDIKSIALSSENQSKQSESYSHIFKTLEFSFDKFTTAFGNANTIVQSGIKSVVFSNSETLCEFKDGVLNLSQDKMKHILSEKNETQLQLLEAIQVELCKSLINEDKNFRDIAIEEHFNSDSIIQYKDLTNTEKALNTPFLNSSNINKYNHELFHKRDEKLINSSINQTNYYTQNEIKTPDMKDSISHYEEQQKLIKNHQDISKTQDSIHPSEMNVTQALAYHMSAYILDPSLPEKLDNNIKELEDQEKSAEPSKKESILKEIERNERSLGLMLAAKNAFIEKSQLGVKNLTVHNPNKPKTLTVKGLKKSLKGKVPTFTGYKLQKRINFQGLRISIETKKGKYRYWTDEKGKKGKTKMKYDYGYIRNTLSGLDGDHIDCFVGNNKISQHVFIVHQNKQGGGFDEDKVMLGFNSLEEAREAYLAHYTSEQFLGSITYLPFKQFKKKVLGKKVDMIKGYSLDIRDYLK